jgi:hypothetical protein
VGEVRVGRIEFATSLAVSLSAASLLASVSPSLDHLGAIRVKRAAAEAEEVASQHRRRQVSDGSNNLLSWVEI